MEKTFKNELQTHIQNLGVKNGKFILKETQHPLDRWLHEGYIADTLYRIGGQRRETARDVLRTELAASIATVNETALALQLTQNEELIDTGNYTLNLQAKRPSVRLNATRLKTELIKAGVAMPIIDLCFDRANEPQTPVNVFTINTTGNGG